MPAGYTPSPSTRLITHENEMCVLLGLPIIRGGTPYFDSKISRGKFHYVLYDANLLSDEAIGKLFRWANQQMNCKIKFNGESKIIIDMPVYNYI